MFILSNRHPNKQSINELCDSSLTYKLPKYYLCDDVELYEVVWDYILDNKYITDCFYIVDCFVGGRTINFLKKEEE